MIRQEIREKREGKGKDKREEAREKGTRAQGHKTPKSVRVF